jgi:hypothetical protein
VKQETSKKQAASSSCLVYFSALKVEAIDYSETSVEFTGLHEVTAQKIDPSSLVALVLYEGT